MTAPIEIVVVSAVSSVVLGLITNELFAWAPRLADMLLSIAVRLLPERHQERAALEWKTGLDDIPGGLGKLVSASFYVFYASAYRGGVVQALFSRVRDIQAGVFLVLIFLPMLWCVGLMIRVESSGPILFYQRRYGEGGRIIHIPKFRSMTVTSSGGDGPWDSRVTPVGTVLRRLGLDELPVLLSVINGDLSLIGWRPIPLGEAVVEDGKVIVPEGKPGLFNSWDDLLRTMVKHLVEVD